jgi:hypothetical protein
MNTRQRSRKKLGLGSCSLKTALKVYQKALASVMRLIDRAASWDKRPAVVDQLERAS